ncbi:MAG: tRNA (adenosine(37)-N6)-threonylcarbamoyltransferase complex ATPase subunit type 1 TsaE [Burkholderiales bacterium]|nr:tRNA (adenosine(37)-N6)-threonylcarbamoyltransferase complex ATPase subunit type 1 TsaE [Burkholderiales bacterium]
MIKPAMRIIRSLPDESATREIGVLLARGVEPGMMIYLSGELGSGKTTLVRALLRARGVGGRIKSPTFTLVEVYSVSKLNFYHFDFYRFNNPDEWMSTGFRDYFRDDAVCLVEWPEKAGDSLPSPDIRIHLRYAADARVAEILAPTVQGQRCLSQLNEAIS